MEQILWFIKLICTSLVKGNSLGASTVAGADFHPQLSAGQGWAGQGTRAACVLPAGGQQCPKELH